MKQFDELDATQQAWALDRARDALIRALLVEGLCFNDHANGDDLQARIDAAITRADDMQTAWFASSYLMDDPVVKSAVDAMACCDAEDALYADADDPHVIPLPALKRSPVA